MATDQLNFLIYEPDNAVQQTLRRFVTHFSVRADVDVRMDWVSKPEQLVHIPALAHDAHIALLNADSMPHTLTAGLTVLQANPDCRIVYYGSRTHDLKQYFPARPVAYLDHPTDPTKWDRTLQALHAGLRESGEHFTWTSKFCRYFIPCSQIVTLRSSQGNLEVHTHGGTIHTVPGKLDEAEKRLPADRFLRVHKSTLVNTRCIRAMDRSDKSLVLHDGTRAYISKAHYKAVSQFMETLMHTEKGE